MSGENITIGFVGFGEASYHIAGGLKEEGAPAIRAYDVQAHGHPRSGMIQTRAGELGVALEPSLEALIRACDVIISANSAKAALPVAREAAGFLAREKLYVDLNAASPDVKRQIAEVLGEVPFVDAAVVESVPAFRHRVPMLVSGSGAERFAEIARRVRMQVTPVGGEPGSASAIKMARSIFLKGFTMLLLETLSLSRQFGVEEDILQSIEKSITRASLKERANDLIARSAIHAGRRVAEMEEVLHTLRSAGLDGTMSEATRNKLQMLVDLELNRHFNFEAPEGYAPVIDAIREMAKKQGISKQ